MRYFTWKLAWPTEAYGFGPEEWVSESGSSLTSSEWMLPQNIHGTILGYMEGEYQPEPDNEWHLIEVSLANALTFATQIDATAFVDADGKIKSLLPKPN